MMPWWAAGLLANASIMVVEYLNRTGQYATFWHALLHTGVFIVIAQWGLWAAWSRAPSLMLAWAMFTAGNSLFRLVSVRFMVGEPLSERTLIGVGLMMVALYFIKSG